jgi:osmoprotectant transport system permease protein
VIAWLAIAALAQAPVSVGSKKFTESVVLGELLAVVARDAGAEVEHRRELGGTRVVWEALRRGDIDAYVEYTGTLRAELVPDAGPGLAGLRDALAAEGLVLGPPLGFENTYALATTPERAEALGLVRISDLLAHPDLRLRLGNEFMDRADGWPSLRDAYGLPHTDVRGLDHDLAYRGLVAGDLDVMDAYTTDAELSAYGLVTLDDDRRHFPEYQAVPIWRADLHPAVADGLARLGGVLTAPQMAALNARARIDRVPEAEVAAAFAHSELGMSAAVSEGPGWLARLLATTLDHLFLVGVSLGAGIVVAVPLGVVAARRERLGRVVLGVVGVVQTIPSLALLVVLIPVLGIGTLPALVALFLYSLLPIVRGTHAGLTGIDPALQEAAVALGLTEGQRLWRVELPLAARSILSGIQTAAVIDVGTATLGALIGAGGYGQPILTGIRLDDTALILEGAVPAAVLAVGVSLLFDVVGRRVLWD